jgi:hypothetical protein
MNRPQKNSAPTAAAEKTLHHFFGDDHQSFTSPKTLGKRRRRAFAVDARPPTWRNH